MAKPYEYCVVSQSGGELDCFRKKTDAKKLLAEEIKDNAARCRRAHKRCSIVRSANGAEIKVGGRQGYHRWNHLAVVARHRY